VPFIPDTVVLGSWRPPVTKNRAELWPLSAARSGFQVVSKLLLGGFRIASSDGERQLAGNDLGTGSGWKQSRQNQTGETRSPSTTANLHAALAAASPLTLL
jgi:hypothetical protein